MLSSEWLEFVNVLKTQMLWKWAEWFLYQVALIIHKLGKKIKKAIVREENSLPTSVFFIFTILWKLLNNSGILWKLMWLSQGLKEFFLFFSYIFCRIGRVVQCTPYCTARQAFLSDPPGTIPASPSMPSWWNFEIFFVFCHEAVLCSTVWYMTKYTYISDGTIITVSTVAIGHASMQTEF